MKLYNVTNGYNCQTLIPPDTRYNNINFDRQKIPDSAEDFFPATFRDYYLSESNNVQDPHRSYDPSITNLMDVGLIRDWRRANFDRHGSNIKELEKTRMHQYHSIAAYVTGAEKTTIAASILSLEDHTVTRAYQAESFDSSESGGIMEVLLPQLQNVSILRTDTPVKQVQIVDPTLLRQHDYTTRFSGLLVRTGSDISLHRWSYLPPKISKPANKPDTIHLSNTYRLSLKQDVSDPVVHCCHAYNSDSRIAVVRGSGALTYFSYTTTRGQWTYVKCPPLQVHETYSRWHRVKEVEHPSYGNSMPESLLVANRKSLLLYDARANQYVGNLIPNINTTVTSLRDFQTSAIRNLPSFERVVNSTMGDHQYFVLLSNKVQWMDMRYPKDTLLSVPHHMDPDDPSLQLTMAYLPEKELHVATVYSEWSHLSTVCQFGRDYPKLPEGSATEAEQKDKNFESLPVMPQNPRIFSTEPTKATQTLRTFALRANAYEPEQKPIVMGALEYTTDHGLYSHIWSSDPTVKIDLHEIDPDPAYAPLHQILLSRGLHDTSDQPQGPVYLNLRRAYKLLYDVERKTSSIETDVTRDLISAAQDGFISDRTTLNGLIQFKDGLQIHALDRCSNLKAVLAEFEGLQLEDQTGQVTVHNNLHCLLDGTKMDTIKEFQEYLKLLWMLPLKGFAPPRELEKAVLESAKKPSQRFVLPHPRLAKHHRYRKLLRSRDVEGHKPVTRTVVKPEPSDSDDDETTPQPPRPPIKVRWFRPRQSYVGITRRSVRFPKSFHESFTTRRKRVLDQIASEVSMACHALYHPRSRQSRTQVEENYNDVLAPLRKYLFDFNIQSLSNDVETILGEWTIEGETSGGDNNGSQVPDTQADYTDLAATQDSGSQATQPVGSILMSASQSSQRARRKTAGRKSMRFAPLPPESSQASSSQPSLDPTPVASQVSQQDVLSSQIPPPMSQMENAETGFGLNGAASGSQLTASQQRARRRRSTMVPSQQTRKRRKTTEGF